MNTKYLKLGLLLLPLLFVSVLFFLPDKTVKTDEDVPQDVIDYVNKEFAYSGDLHVIKEKGATIFVRWTDPANAPPGDPVLDVYHVLSDPYNEKKEATEMSMHAIILRNNNNATTTVTLVTDTISYPTAPGSWCTADGAQVYWEPSCKPVTPAQANNVYTWGAAQGGPWTISPFGQRVFRHTHDGTASGKGPLITSTTHVDLAEGQESYEPGDEQYSMADDEKCTPTFNGFSFTGVNGEWYSAYPEDGTANYYDPGTYENQAFYFEMENDSDQGTLAIGSATLTFPESWNVDSCACDGTSHSTCDCDANQGTPDTVTFSGEATSGGHPDGWKWAIQVDFPRSGGFGVVQVTDWISVTHGDCEGPVGTAYTEAGYIEFPIYILAAFNLEQNDWRWYDNSENVQPGLAMEEENTKTDEVGAGDILRLRMNLTVDSGTFTASSSQFKLQYAKKDGDNCSGMGESWSDVGDIDSSAIWRGYNNTPADGATIGVDDALLDSSQQAGDAAESYEEQNPSALNPREVTQGNEGEWDWVIQHNGAKGGTDYCFRMIYSHGGLLPSYDSYPLLTTYQAATWREAEDTDIPTKSLVVEKGEKVRLRISAANTGTGIAPDHKFRLQYAAMVGSVCDTDESYTDVPVTATTTQHFEMAASTHIVDKGPTTFQFDNSEGYATTTAGQIVENPSYETEEISLPAENYVEIEYAFKATDDADDGEYYCFRVRDETTNLDVYDKYPQLQIAEEAVDINVSGTAYENEGSGKLDACDSSTPMIRLRVGGTTYDAVSCNASTGQFTFSDISGGSAGSPMVFWIDGTTCSNSSHCASTVFRYSGSGDVEVGSVELRKNRLMIMSDSGNVTNANLGTCDHGIHTDVIYDVDGSNNLELEDGYKLIVNDGDTYEPGGQVTTSPSSDSSTTDGDIEIEATGVMTVGTNAISCGGDWDNSGTFTKSSSQTITFSATAAGHSIAWGDSNFDNITFNGSSGGWTLQASTTVDSALTTTAGTLVQGTDNNLTIKGNVSMAANTFTKDAGTGTFIFNSGGTQTLTINNNDLGDVQVSTASTIARLQDNATMDNLTIDTNTTFDLDGISNTVTLTIANGGTIANSGTFRAYNDASNITLTSSGTAAITTTDIDYYSNTIRLGGIDLQVNTSLASGEGIVMTGDVTFDGITTVSGASINQGTNNTLTCGGDVSLAADTFYKDAGTGTFIFNSGGAQSLTSAGNNLGDVQLSTASTVVTMQDALTVDNLTLDNSTTLTQGTDHNLTIKGNTSMAANTFNKGGGTSKVIFNSAGTQTLTINNNDLGDVQVSTASTIARLQGNATMDNLTIDTNTTFDLDGTSGTVILTIADTKIIANSGTFRAYNDASNITLTSSGTANFTTTDIDYYSNTIRLGGIDLQVDTSLASGEGIVMTGDVTFDGITTVSGASINQGTNNTLTCGGDVSLAADTFYKDAGTGTFIFNSGGAQSLTSAGNNLGDVQLSTASTVVTMQDALTVDNLTLDTNTTLTQGTDHNLTIKGNTSMAANTFNKGGGTSKVILSPGATKTLTTNNNDLGDVQLSDTSTDIDLGDPLTVDDLTIDLNTTLDTTGSNHAITCSGSWDNSGTFTANSGTVTFDATSGGKTIDAGSSNFNNITFDGSSGGWSFSVVPTMNGDVTVTNGELSGTNGMTVNGGAIICDGTCGTINFSDGTVTLSGTGNFGTDALASDWTFNNLTFSGITTSQGTGTITVGGTLTISASQSLDAGSKTWKLTNTGSPFSVGSGATFTANSSTFQYTATSTTTNITGAGLTYNNLTLAPSASGSPTYRLGTAGSQTITTNGNLVIGDGTNGVTIDWDNYDSTLNVKGNLTLNNNTTWTKSTSATLYLKPTTGTKSLTDNNSSKQDLGDISISGGSSTPVIQLATAAEASTIAVADGHSLNLNDKDLNITDGALTTASGGTITCSECSASTVTILETGNLGGGSGSITFYNLNLGDNAETGTTTAASDFTVNNVFTIDGGVSNHTFNASTYTITLTDFGTPFVISGVFNANESTVEYTGTSNTNITTTTYNHLTLAPTSGSPDYIIGSDTLTINSNFTLGDGTNEVDVKANSNNPIINTGSSVPAENTTFLIKDSAIFTGGSNNLSVYGDMTINDGGTYTKGSGNLIFDGGNDANPRYFKDENGSKQDMGDVYIGTSPAVTRLKSHTAMDNLTVSADDKYYTQGWEVDVAQDVTVNGTLDCDDTGGSGYEGNGTTIYVGRHWTVGAGATFTADEDSGYTTTVVFNESSSGTLSPGGTDENHDFYDFEITKSSTATITLDGAIDVEDDLTISNSDSTLDVSATDYAVTVAGDWTNSGTFSEQEGTVTFDGIASATLTSGCTNVDSCTNENFYSLTINKTASGGSDDNLTLQTNHLRITNTLTITNGELIQGNLNVRAEGSSAVSVAADGKWTDVGTGNLTLGGTFDNAGIVEFDTNDVGCAGGGGSDDILIRSTATSTQRSWTGSGTFIMYNIDVKDQGGTASIEVSDGTNSGGNGENWIFSACVVEKKFRFKNLKFQGDFKFKQ